jgi:hypothetical protein
MANMEIIFGARKRLNVCTRTKPGESVVIVTNSAMEEIAIPLAAAAMEVGVEPTPCVITQRTSHDQEPLRPTAAALAVADIPR